MGKYTPAPAKPCKDCGILFKGNSVRCKVCQWEHYVKAEKKKRKEKHVKDTGSIK